MDNNRNFSSTPSKEESLERKSMESEFGKAFPMDKQADGETLVRLHLSAECKSDLSLDPNAPNSPLMPQCPKIAYFSMCMHLSLSLLAKVR
jgi:hypothetical protein